MIIEWESNGRTIRAHQVGRYLFHVCCRGDREEDQEAAHVVVHKDSGERLLCGLTQSGAAMLADALSTYGEDCPVSFGRGPHIQLVMKWAWEALVVDWGKSVEDLELEPFTTWHERPEELLKRMS
jgi:hypothetical protein